MRLCVCSCSLSPSLTRIGWDSNPRNGYPFTRSPGVCLQPLGHLSKQLDPQTHRRVVNTKTLPVSLRAPAPRNPHPSRAYTWSLPERPIGEERRMNTLPKKREPGEAPEVNAIPTWRELANRFRDLMKDFLKEGKELERELEPKLLPALKRLKLEIEKLIGKLEQRAK